MNQTDRLKADCRGPSAGRLFVGPSWADVDVLADGERVVQNARTDYKGYILFSESFWQEHGGKRLDVYIRQTSEERNI